MGTGTRWIADRKRTCLHPSRGIGGTSRDPKRGSSRLEARSNLHVGELRQTNPIQPGRQVGSLGGEIVRNKANSDGNGAKQSQFRRTDRKRQTLCRKGVMVNLAYRERRRNKANLSMRAETDAGRRSHWQSRCWGKLRQTNPICRRRAGKTIAKASGLDAATLPGANVPNKPNLLRIGARSAASRSAVQTKPTCPEPIGMAAGCEDGTCCRLRGQVCKTKPIAARRARRAVQAFLFAFPPVYP